MKTYDQMTKEELLQEQERLQKEYKGFEEAGLQLNMARGKPERAQLELSMPMLDLVDSKSDCLAEDGTDCRNYGELDGLPEARRLMAEIMECRPEQVIVFGNASLNVMFDAVTRYMLPGVGG